MNKIKFLLALGAALCISAASASAQTLTDVNTKYNEAVALIKEKHYDQAIPVLEATIEMGFSAGPEASNTITQAQNLLPECYLREGKALCSQRKFEEGIVSLTKAVELGELYGNQNVVRNGSEAISQAYLLLGDSAYKAKDYPRAIEYFAKGYEVSPTNTELALYLAESYAESGDLDNGLRIYREVAALEARHSRYKEAADKAKKNIVYYLTLRAGELAGQGRVEDAYSMLGDILANDAGNADIHLLRVQTAVNASQWGRIVEWGEQAAALQPTPERQSDVYFFIGVAHQNSDNVPAAIAAYRKVTSGPNAAKALEQIELLNNPKK